MDVKHSIYYGIYIWANMSKHYFHIKWKSQQEMKHWEFIKWMAAPATKHILNWMWVTYSTLEWHWSKYLFSFRPDGFETNECVCVFFLQTEPMFVFPLKSFNWLLVFSLSIPVGNRSKRKIFFFSKFVFVSE